MVKKILYIGGGFDILHQDHKKFIKQGIKIFNDKYGDLEQVIVGLKSDAILNSKKGIMRPFFPYEWREQDISTFLTKIGINHEIILTTQFISKFNKKNDVVAQVKSGYTFGGEQLEKIGTTVEYVNPFNSVNTSTIKKRLFEVRNMSNCNLRKVGALLIREGQIISEGYSGSGDCNCCSKYFAYQKDGGKLSKHIDCDYPHAEVVVLDNASKGDDLLITDSPCFDCAKLIVDKGIKRVVYIQEYHNLSPIKDLKNSGIKIRKAGQ